VTVGRPNAQHTGDRRSCRGMARDQIRLRSDAAETSRNWSSVQLASVPEFSPTDAEPAGATQHSGLTG
jgi:hypothetical protein